MVYCQTFSFTVALFKFVITQRTFTILLNTTNFFRSSLALSVSPLSNKAYLTPVTRRLYSKRSTQEPHVNGQSMRMQMSHSALYRKQSVNSIFFDIIARARIWNTGKWKTKEKFSGSTRLKDLDIMLQAKLFQKTTFSGLFVCSSPVCAFLVNAMCEWFLLANRFMKIM